MKPSTLRKILVLLLAVVSCSAQAAYSECNWNEPGADRYTGSPEAAVDFYKDIPWIYRYLLKQKVGKLASRHDTIEIYQDAIIGGKYKYSPLVMDMHFGSLGKVCGDVHRSSWTDFHHEPADVYCVQSYCVGIPSVCGNVFRLKLLGPKRAAASVQTVSEPSSLVLSFAALFLLGLFTTRRRSDSTRS